MGFSSAVFPYYVDPSNNTKLGLTKQSKMHGGID